MSQIFVRVKKREYGRGWEYVRCEFIYHPSFLSRFKRFKSSFQIKVNSPFVFDKDMSANKTYTYNKDIFYFDPEYDKLFTWIQECKNPVKITLIRDYIGPAPELGDTEPYRDDNFMNFEFVDPEEMLLCQLKFC